jgi:hypothetical protein
MMGNIMAIENVRLVESIVIDKDNPQYAELIESTETDFDFVQDKYGKWSVRGTGESVSFATKEDEASYKRGLMAQ